MAIAAMDGLEVSATGGALWSEMSQGVASEILSEWYRSEGPDKFRILVNQLKEGHQVKSPIEKSFLYRAGSLAGQQQQMFEE